MSETFISESQSLFDRPRGEGRRRADRCVETLIAICEKQGLSRDVIAHALLQGAVVAAVPRGSVSLEKVERLYGHLLAFQADLDLEIADLEAHVDLVRH